MSKFREFISVCSDNLFTIVILVWVMCICMNHSISLIRNSDRLDKENKELKAKIETLEKSSVPKNFSEKA